MLGSRDAAGAPKTLPSGAEAALRFGPPGLLAFFTGVGSAVTDADDAFLELTGLTREDLEAGDVDWVSMTPAADRAVDEEAWKDVVQSGRTDWYRKRFIRPDGTTVLVDLAAVVVGAGEPVRWLAAMHPAASAAGPTPGGNAERLLALARQLAEAASTADVIEAVCFVGATAAGARYAGIGLVDGDDVVISHDPSLQGPFVERVRVGLSEVCALPEALVRDEVVWVDADRYAVDHDLMRGSDLDALAVVPFGDDEHRGVLLLGWVDGDDLADDHELYRLAHLVADSLGRSRRLERETEVADALLAALLPASVDPGLGVDVAIRYLPVADRLGGDFYDVVRLDDGHLVFIGDVAGHGLDAARIMATTRAYLRALGLEYGDPARMLAVANRLLVTDPRSDLVTSVVARWHAPTRELTVANAGHLAPLVRAAGGATTPLSAERGPILGAFDDADYREMSVRLPKESTMVLYTDGLVERRSEDLGASVDDLVAVLDRLPPSTDAETMADVLVGERSSDDLVDDAAVVVVRLH